MSEPVSYIALSTELGLKADFENWIYTVSTSWDSYDYDDTRRRNGTISIQDDRDRDDYGVQLKTGYKLSSDLVVYLRVGLNERNYDNRIDSSAAFTRDSDGYDVLSGMTYKGLNLTGDFVVGYAQQNYDAAELPSVSAPAFLFDGTWEASQRVSLRFQADSSIKDTTNTGVSAYIQNRFRVNYNHDLNEQTEFGINLQYINNNFETNTSLNPISRQDDVYEGEVYDNVGLRLSYGYRDRQSNVSTAEYESHKIGARLVFDY